MLLAADPITIEIAGEDYALRPTLLAAARLARRYRDFATIYREVLADHVTVTRDVIREGSGSPRAAADFCSACSIPSLRSTLAPLKLPLLRFVLQLAGHDDAAEAEPAASGKPIPFAEYHAELFRIGTGWLGWTPADTWAATPTEILEAQHGRTELISQVLKAVFGEPEPDTTPAGQAPAPFVPNADGTDPTFDREKLRRLKAKIAMAA